MVEQMVDHSARKRLVELIQQVVSSEITIKQFCNQMPKSDDLAIREIFSSIIRIFTDYGWNDRINGRVSMSDENISKYVLFLKSDFIFEWPPRKKRLPYLLDYIAVRLGFNNPKKDGNEYTSRGEIQVWPFLSRADYEAVVGKGSGEKR